MNSANSISQGMTNGFDRGRLDTLPVELRDKVERRDRVLGPGYRLFYDVPVEVVRGSGTYLYDSAGTEYLDAYNNVPCVGHAHPRIVDAVHRQMQLVNTNTRYVQDLVVNYAEDLLSTFPDELGNVTFTSTGSEANDLALRVSRKVTGSEGIIVTANAYHGLTAAVAACSPSLGINSPLGPHVRTIPPPDPRMSPSNFPTYFATEVHRAIAELRRHGYGLSAFLADSIFSSDGIFADPQGILAPVIDAVHAAGGLYIADEVQPGFGRTGAQWWGFQRHGITPDIVTVGKPMGNGLPIAAAVFKPHLLTDFGRDIRYFNTFGGNSVSIAAAHEVLRVIRDEELIINAEKVGTILRDGITQITSGDPRFTDIRGAGLFIGVEMGSTEHPGSPDPDTATSLVNRLRDRRVLISASGRHGNVLKIRPPMAFRSADAERLLTQFELVVRSEP
ncbi:aspartate aminotransferase family protein [Rhodococcus globerulus]|uniref:Aspartate aminotransferase family protein n=1 Tax=Rhodococcus globerulus TaxID=33008 RepID=A0ABU4C2T2_RHOGO|nr:aspartate aminotransferase family protein [Rhodococcus globerulus]MDV6270807.1 aspartate aminotransferase family protein [Rhodococcus globerulus]